MPLAAVLQLLLALLAGVFCLDLPAQAQGSSGVQLKTGSDGGNDADLANMFSVRSDYFKRFPHAKVSEDIRSGGRIPDTTKEIRGSTYKMQASNEIINIPAGPLIMQQTGPPKSPDPYFATRPQYRPLFSYVGGLPGAFLPAPQPGMVGMFVPNYSKVASGQGGGVHVSIPLQPTCYVQPLLQFNNQANLAQEGDQAVWQYELTTFGVGPISDTQFQMLDRESNQRFLELFFDPERWLWASRAASIMQQQQMSTNLANTADFGTNTAVATIIEPLLNVANDDPHQHFAVQGNPTKKSKGQAAYMVQQMYHNVFLNIGILLLLPGALMTQLKTMVQGGFMGKPEGDWETPFTGIIRSIIAIFLIPATQLIMSYLIDVGNTMAFEVQKWVDVPTITGYAHEQQFGPQRDMTLNCLIQHLKPPQSQSSTDSDTQIDGSGGSGGGSGGSAGAGGGTSSSGAGSSRGSGKHLGKAYSGHENEAIEEETPQLSKQIQMMYNLFNVCATSGVVVLADFQLVMMCYLMLMGPIAAAFYAWPNVGGSGSPGVFNKIFDNWLQAVVILSLWRFWWMVVLACLTSYIQFSKQLGIFNDASEWEMMVYTSFQVLLLTVPFAPFDFSASAQIGQIEQIASKKVDGDGGGGGGGGAGGGAGGGGAGGGSGGGAGGGSSSGGGSSGSMSVSGTSSGSGGSAGGSGGSSGGGSSSSAHSASDAEGAGGGESGGDTQMRIASQGGGGGSSSGGGGSSGAALAASDASDEDDTPPPPPMSS